MFEYLLAKTYSSGLSCHDAQDRTALHHAAVRGPDSSIIGLVREAWKEDPDIMDQVMIDQRDKFGWTALQLAVLRGSIIDVDTLLELGANVNIRDEQDGSTVLHLTCIHTRISYDMCKLLVKAGCNHLLQNDVGITALQYARDTNNTSVAKYLALLSPSKTSSIYWRERFSKFRHSASAFLR
jgi:hypothetical protein